jgi:hypothetical protein
MCIALEVYQSIALAVNARERISNRPSNSGNIFNALTLGALDFPANASLQLPFLIMQQGTRIERSNMT